MILAVVNAIYTIALEAWKKNRDWFLFVSQNRVAPERWQLSRKWYIMDRVLIDPFDITAISQYFLA